MFLPTTNAIKVPSVDYIKVREQRKTMRAIRACIPKQFKAIENSDSRKFNLDHLRYSVIVEFIGHVIPPSFPRLDICRQTWEEYAAKLIRHLSTREDVKSGAVDVDPYAERIVTIINRRYFCNYSIVSELGIPVYDDTDLWIVNSIPDPVQTDVDTSDCNVAATSTRTNVRDVVMLNSSTISRHASIREELSRQRACIEACIESRLKPVIRDLVAHAVDSATTVDDNPRFLPPLSTPNVPSLSTPNIPPLFVPSSSHITTTTVPSLLARVIRAIETYQSSATTLHAQRVMGAMEEALSAMEQVHHPRLSV